MHFKQKNSSITGFCIFRICIIFHLRERFYGNTHTLNLIWKPSKQFVFPFKLKRILIGSWWSRTYRKLLICVLGNLLFIRTFYSFTAIPFIPLWAPLCSGYQEQKEELHDNSIIFPPEALFSNFGWLPESPGNLVKRNRPAHLLQPVCFPVFFVISPADAEILWSLRTTSLEEDLWLVLCLLLLTKFICHPLLGLVKEYHHC